MTYLHTKKNICDVAKDPIRSVPTHPVKKEMTCHKVTNLRTEA